MSEKQRYWHVFGGEVEDFGGSWALITLDTLNPPEEMEGKALKNGLSYLASFDHKPTEAEQEALMPPEYQE